jgi:hypothetical protein
MEDGRAFVCGVQAEHTCGAGGAARRGGLLFLRGGSYACGFLKVFAE